MQASGPTTLTIVIPCFNEAARLPHTLENLAQLKPALASHDLDLQQVLVVDDGSSDLTLSVAKEFQDILPLEVIRSTQNRGKGSAVRLGCQKSTSAITLIADADLSTPWLEILKLKKALEQGSQIAIGSRSVATSFISIRQPWYRERMGKTFNLLMTWLTGLEFHDTQCGFKLFVTEPLRHVWAQMRVNRFAWDVEFLMRAQKQGLFIQEVGVEWSHQEASRVHPLRDASEMLWTVVQLRFSKLSQRVKT